MTNGGIGSEGSISQANQLAASERQRKTGGSGALQRAFSVEESKETIRNRRRLAAGAGGGVGQLAAWLEEANVSNNVKAEDQWRRRENESRNEIGENQ